jgi:exodeoxyribonuclease VIII
MRHYTDIMLDLETLGTGNNAAIIQIGAVAFNADGENGSLWTNSPDSLAELGQGFRVNVNLAESRHPGIIDASSVEWWLQQSQEARDSITKTEGRLELGAALEAFVRWLYTVTPKVRALRVWSNGPTFDETILRAAFTRYGAPLPLSFRGSRCCRTMIELAELHGWNRKEAASGAPQDITKHDALSDAVFQARGVASQRHFLRVSANMAGCDLSTGG